MSTSKAHHHPSGPVHWCKCHPIVVYLLRLLLLLVVLATVARILRNDRVTPDEKAAAAKLLANQLIGPRYFQIPAGDVRDGSGVTVVSANEPHITTEAARVQVVGVVKARHFSTEQAAKVQALIDRLKEPPGSRLVGVEHINLLRLNLALDALP